MVKQIKKKYIQPDVSISHIRLENMICVSNTENSGVISEEWEIVDLGEGFIL